MKQFLTGNLLVASSLVSDPVYAGGVCLIVHHDQSNVIGVMLNRPMKPSPQALLEMLDQAESSVPGNNRLAQHYDAAADEDVLDQSADLLPGDHEAGFGESVGTEIDQSEGHDGQSDSTGLSADQDSLFGMLHFGGPRSGPVVAIHQTSRYAEAETGEGIYVAAQKQHLAELVRDHPAPYRLIVGHLGWEVDELAAEMESGLWHTIPATTDAVFSPASEMWTRLIRRATSNSLANWLDIPDVVAAGDLN